MPPPLLEVVAPLLEVLVALPEVLPPLPALPEAPLPPAAWAPPSPPRPPPEPPQARADKATTRKTGGCLMLMPGSCRIYAQESTVVVQIPFLHGNHAPA